MANAQTEKNPTKMLVPVINNEERLTQLALPSKPGKGGMLPGTVIQLKPGMNFIPADQWAQAKENENVRNLLTDVIQPSRAPEVSIECVGKFKLVEMSPVTGDNPLASMKETEAVAAIAEIFDVALLKKLAAQETRARVARALQNAITKIEKPAGKKAS